MSDVKFVVCFIAEDGRHFHWRDYATFGGARRFITERWTYGHLRAAHHFESWYILRQTAYFDAPIGQRVRGVVIAQQKDAMARNPYRVKG